MSSADISPGFLAGAVDQNVAGTKEGLSGSPFGLEAVAAEGDTSVIDGFGVGKVWDLWIFGGDS